MYKFLYVEMSDSKMSDSKMSGLDINLGKLVGRGSNLLSTLPTHGTVECTRLEDLIIEGIFVLWWISIKVFHSTYDTSYCIIHHT